MPAMRRVAEKRLSAAIRSCARIRSSPCKMALPVNAQNPCVGPNRHTRRTPACTLVSDPAQPMIRYQASQTIATGAGTVKDQRTVACAVFHSCSTQRINDIGGQILPRLERAQDIDSMMRQGDFTSVFGRFGNRIQTRLFKHERIDARIGKCARHRQAGRAGADDDNGKMWRCSKGSHRSASLAGALL